MNSFRECIAKLAEESEQLHKSLDQYVRLAKEHATDQRIEKMLGVEAGS